jgi:hypothetical protein
MERDRFLEDRLVDSMPKSTVNLGGEDRGHIETSQLFA